MEILQKKKEEYLSSLKQVNEQINTLETKLNESRMAAIRIEGAILGINEMLADIQKAEKPEEPNK